MSDIIKTEFERGLTPEAVQARQTLMDGKVPKDGHRQHPGKGGKTFDYFSHVWGNKQLRDGLGAYWNFACLQWEVFDDKSAATLTRLWVDWPTEDGGSVRQEVTCVGAFEDGTGKFCNAFIIASASSRGLAKCMMRMFGVGSEFYEDDEKITPKQAWNALKRFGESKGVDADDIVDALKEANIKSDDLDTRFEEAYGIVAELAGTKPTQEEVPDDLK